MANQWLRLWHDMPTDPKWRTISKVSGQRIGDVISVFAHLLVCASNATERGRTQSFNCEDVASALDLETEQVTAIIDAMQARVLDGDKLKGWDFRQVAREDGSAERAKAWREAQKIKSERAASAAERNQTPDKDTDKKNTRPSRSASVAKPDGIAESTWSDFQKLRKARRSPLTDTALEVIRLEADKAGYTLEQALTTCCLRGWQGFEALWVSGKPITTKSGEMLPGAI